MKKSHALMILPVIMIIVLFTILTPETKNPELILNQAQIKFNNLESYTIEMQAVMDIILLEMPLKYISNITTVYLNGEQYVRTVTAVPFSNEIIINEDFITNQGSFSCTNSINDGVCVKTNQTLNTQESNEYIKLNYLGSKKVNNFDCEAVYSEFNASTINNSIKDINQEYIDSIKSIFSYSCVNPENGLTVESIIGIKGETNYYGMLVDTSFNVTKQVISFSNQASNESFKIPYEIITQEEYDNLLNIILEESLSQDL